MEDEPTRSDEPPAFYATYEAWVLATWPHAVAYAASLLRDRGLAEDIAQECYYNLLKKADVYDLLRDGMKLLLRSVTNACIKKNTRSRPQISLSTLTREEEAVTGDLVDESAREPVQLLLSEELKRAVEAGLAQLPLMQQAALELRILGWSLAEIADTLGISATNAGVLVHRARKELAQQLAPFLKETIE